MHDTRSSYVPYLSQVPEVAGVEIFVAHKVLIGHLAGSPLSDTTVN